MLSILETMQQEHVHIPTTKIRNMPGLFYNPITVDEGVLLPNKGPQPVLWILSHSLSLGLHSWSSPVSPTSPIQPSLWIITISKQLWPHDSTLHPPSATVHCSAPLLDHNSAYACCQHLIFFNDKSVHSTLPFHPTSGHLFLWFLCGTLLSNF